MSKALAMHAKTLDTTCDQGESVTAARVLGSWCIPGTQAGAVSTSGMSSTSEL